MIRSITSVLLLVCCIMSNNPQYAIAAGLFELASVIYCVASPRRFKTDKSGR